MPNTPPARQPGSGPAYNYTEAGDTHNYEMADSTDSAFYINGIIDSKGDLNFIVVAEKPSENKRSHIPGHVFFNNMIVWFQRQGTTITRIIGNWVFDDPDQRTNIDLFNTYLNNHPAASEIEAAENTKTGR